VHKIFFLKIPWRTTISSDFWKGFVEASHLNLRLATVTFNVRHRLFSEKSVKGYFIRMRDDNENEKYPNF